MHDNMNKQETIINQDSASGYSQEAFLGIRWDDFMESRGTRPTTVRVITLLSVICGTCCSAKNPFLPPKCTVLCTGRVGVVNLSTGREGGVDLSTGRVGRVMVGQNSRLMCNIVKSLGQVTTHSGTPRSGFSNFCEK